MKAISIKNPWPYLIAWGIKDVENRTLRTHYRGRFYIHVSQKWDKRIREMSLLFTKKQFESMDHITTNKLIHPNLQTDMVTGAIIGEATIVDCIHNSKSIWAEKDKWHFILEDQVLYDKPILDVKGQQTYFWEYNK